MKVRITFEYDEEFAKALGSRNGQKRARRRDVKEWIDEALLSESAILQHRHDVKVARSEAPSRAASGKDDMEARK